MISNEFSHLWISGDPSDSTAWQGNSTFARMEPPIRIRRRVPVSTSRLHSPPSRFSAWYPQIEGWIYLGYQCIQFLFYSFGSSCDLCLVSVVRATASFGKSWMKQWWVWVSTPCTAAWTHWSPNVLPAIAWHLFHLFRWHHHSKVSHATVLKLKERMQGEDASFPFYLVIILRIRTSPRNYGRWGNSEWTRVKQNSPIKVHGNLKQPDQQKRLRLTYFYRFGLPSKDGLLNSRNALLLETTPIVPWCSSGTCDMDHHHCFGALGLKTLDTTSFDKLMRQDGLALFSLEDSLGWGLKEVVSGMI